MSLQLKYDAALMPEIEDSLKSDFWVYGPVSAPLIGKVTTPVKFSETVAIYLRRGKVKFMISLRPYEVEGPATLVVYKEDILQVEEYSEDVEASCMLFSEPMLDKLMGLIATHFNVASHRRFRVCLIPPEIVGDFDNFYRMMMKINSNRENPTRMESLIFQSAAFFFQIDNMLQPLDRNEEVTLGSRTVEIFLRLVQRNFRSERFLDFYAEKMKITSKHLSRTIKQQTGLTAAQWIERHVILEAKVLLRSSTMNIQEISEYLNFPTQSFFSKYFRKAVGESPSEFRSR